jgi:hypothetical protein
MAGGIFTGRVDIAVPAKNAYFVVSTGLRRSGNWARPIDNGVHRPYGKGEMVLCADTDTGWYILGRGPFSPRGEDDGDTTKTPEELQAEQTPESERKKAQGGTLDTAPNYRAKSEEPILPGDVLIQHRTWPPEDIPTANPSFMGFYRDGSIVIDAGLLSLLLSNSNGAARLRCERLGLEVIPGLSFDMGMVDPTTGKVVVDTSKAENTSFTAGVSDTTREKEKVRVNGYFFSDPDDEGNSLYPIPPDLLFEAGRCKETGDWKNGISPRTKDKKLGRGFKFRFYDFLDFEIDIENKELRLTIYDPDNPAPAGSPFQFRLNPDEAVLTKGAQFISFQEKGIFLKGQLLGFAGPWTMWSEADTAKFSHDSMPQTRVNGKPFLSTVCEWKDDILAPGVKFTTSAFFGQNEEPAVLQSFLTDTYARDMRDLAIHTHNIITPVPGTPTTVATIPPTAIGDWVQSAAMAADKVGLTYLGEISKIKI